MKGIAGTGRFEQTGDWNERQERLHERPPTTQISSVAVVL